MFGLTVVSVCTGGSVARSGAVWMRTLRSENCVNFYVKMDPLSSCVEAGSEVVRAPCAPDGGVEALESTVVG